MRKLLLFLSSRNQVTEKIGSSRVSLASGIPSLTTLWTGSLCTHTQHIGHRKHAAAPPLPSPSPLATHWPYLKIYESLCHSLPPTSIPSNSITKSYHFYTLRILKICLIASVSPSNLFSTLQQEVLQKTNSGWPLSVNVSSAYQRTFNEFQLSIG